MILTLSDTNPELLIELVTSSLSMWAEADP